MNITANKIYQTFHEKGILDEIVGTDNTVTSIDPIEHCHNNSLIFVDKKEYISLAIAAQPAAVVTKSNMLDDFLVDESSLKTTLLTSKNVRLAQALIRQEFADRNHRDIEWPAIHPTAVIHETANIAEDVIIGPGAVIGRNTQIGKGSIVKANAVLEQDVSIGEICILHPNVVVSYNCHLGDRVILKSGCVIGMEGFGFAQDDKGRSHRIPQTGNVVLEDDVLFGANCTVDRATFGTTRIGAGSKFDTLCHIGHNVDIGEDCVMVTQSSIGGSTTLGKRLVISGQCVVSDHINICDDTVLVQRAGVISDIDKPGIYAGMPTQPLKKYFKNTAIAHKLTDLRKSIQALEKKIKNIELSPTKK